MEIAGKNINMKGTKMSAHEYQKELMKDQPFMRHKEHTSSKTDKEDTGSGKEMKGKPIAEEEDKGMPTGKAENPAKYFGKANKGFSSSVEGRTPAKK